MALTGTGPVTLSRGQFLKKKPGGDYSSYLSYVHARRSAKAPPAAADPLGQMSPGQIRSTIDQTYGQPATDAGITSTGRGMLDPVVAALTSDINSRAKLSSDAIAANSAAAAGELGKIDYGAPYRTGVQEQAAVDAALRDELAGGGASLGNDLKTRLAQIEDPAVAAAAGNVAATGAAAGGTEYARGSASLSDMLAKAAAEKTLGAEDARLRTARRLAGHRRCQP
jgi:hypothetical protein